MTDRQRPLNAWNCLENEKQGRKPFTHILSPYQVSNERHRKMIAETNLDPLRGKVALLFADDRERTMQDVIHAMASRGCKKPDAIADAMWWMRKKELLAADRHIDTGKLIWRRAGQ